MVTKNDERKALEQIKKIVEGLGTDSYIAVAFEGCFGIAEDNINNDMACSMKQRYEMADKEAWDAQKSNSELRKEIESLKKEISNCKELLENDTQIIDSLRSSKQELNKELVLADKKAEYLEEEVTKRDAVINSYQEEVVHLKAKLYDMICEQ